MSDNQAVTRSCVYCGISGAEAHFELIGPPGVRQNWACRQQNLCAVRAAIISMPLADSGPVGLVLQLARELAQVHRTDIDQEYESGNPHPAGSPAWVAHAVAYRPMLSDQDLARLHVVLRAASDWLTHSSNDGWGRQVAKARADLGCKQCRAMGPEPCRTELGHEARSWHAGRQF